MDTLIQSPAIKIVIVAAIVLFLLKTVLKMFEKPKKDAMRVQVRCAACGWTGQVGKYNRVCSKCNSSNLREQR